MAKLTEPVHFDVYKDNLLPSDNIEEDEILTKTKPHSIVTESIGTLAASILSDFSRMCYWEPLCENIHNTELKFKCKIP